MNFNSQTDSTALDFEYQELEEEFKGLLQLDDLDRVVSENPERIEKFKSEIKVSLSDAFKCGEGSPQAHLFLQRILYRINRLKLFWYDGLENYVNEDSAFLFSLRMEIENAWQVWEGGNTVQKKSSDLIGALGDRVEEDIQPEPSTDGLLIRNKISKSGYQRFLAITSLDGLVEASQLSRMLGVLATRYRLC